MKLDRYGHGWPDETETCEECGQPDNCGDCNHKPLTEEDVVCLGGIVTEERGVPGFLDR